MSEFADYFDPREVKRVERDARTLSRALDIPAGIGHDLSLTIGNVTFGHLLDLTPQDMADLHDYFSDGDQHMHIGASEPTSPALAKDGWRNQSVGPAERPESFALTVEPPKGIRKLARKILLG